MLRLVAALLVLAIAPCAVADPPSRTVADEAVAPPLLPPSSVLPPWPLRPYVLLDGDYQAHGSDLEAFDGFSLARARLGVTATPFPWLGAVFVGEYAHGSVGVLDAYATVRLAASGVDLSAGYERIPQFVTGHDTFEYELPVPERTILAQSLWQGRDLGLTAHWLPHRLPLEFWARLGNGGGTLLAPHSNAPAGTLRADLVLGRGDPRASRATTWGARLGASAYVASIPPDVPGLGATVPTGFVFYRPNAVSGLRIVAEWHAVLEAGPVQFTVEAGGAREERSHDTDGNPATPRVSQDPLFAGGIAGEVAWMVTGEHRRVGAWPWDPHHAHAWAHGSWRCVPSAS